MKLLKKLAIVAALSSVASYASAMKPIADADLASVSGQDGVSIAADLKVNIGSFTYTNTDLVKGGSVSFNNINFSGTFAMTLDVINQATFTPEVYGNILGVLNPLDLAATNPALAGAQGAALSAFYGGGDVVKIAIPQIEVGDNHKLNMSVGGISMGGSTASYGAFAMNNIRLQGSTVYIWAH